MYLDLAIAFSCAGVGLTCGWVAHGLGWWEPFEESVIAEAAQATIQLQQAHAEQDRISVVAERLRDYALRMAIDVDEHQTSVREVSNVLSGDESLTPEAMCEIVNRLIEANDSMQSKLENAKERIGEQAEQLESAERRAQTDALTNISNRGAFDEHLARRHALGPDRAGTLMLFDVDHFKSFNDEHGHLAGDEVLRAVAKMLHARLKSYGIVARYGGEEFAAIIDGYSVQQCKTIVESARAAISQQKIEFEGKTLQVTASIGVAETVEGEAIQQWIERADVALYRSKDAGRNCGHWMNGRTPELILLDDSDVLIPDCDEASGDANPNSVLGPNGARGGKKTAAKDPRGAFASLPDHNALQEAFDEIQARSKAIGKPTQMMALHVTGAPTAGAMRTLLQVVRATLLSIDRIGAEDAATLLVCIPATDSEMAQKRVQQIRASADSIQFAETSSDECSILKIGVVQVDSGETMDRVMTRLIPEVKGS